MVKVVAGKYKGRNLNTPDVNTKPTKGSVKEAIFSSLSFNIQDAMVLDLFAGSGAFGIEALSRGAQFCFFNDLGKLQYKIISNNISNLGIKNAAISSLDYKLALNNLKEIKKTFDIVFVDPPYAMDCYQEIIDFLLNNEMLNEDAILVLESNKELDLEKFTSLFNIKVKKYGYTIVSILKKI
jgi:16S rRNA (guanine(966)-N(2))-methyltransferase RsmD